MRTEEIRFVTEVCRTRSMAAAARNLNITPQGLGKAIQKLEKELGVRLFTRTSEGVLPTPACNQIYEKLNAIVNAEDAIREILGEIVAANSEEEIFMISPNTVGVYVEEAIREYNQTYAGHIQVYETVLSDELQEQAFLENQYAYRYCCKEDVENHSLLKADIVKMNYALVVGDGSPILEKEIVGYEDLSAMTLLIEDARYPHIRVLLKNFEKVGAEQPKIKSVTTNSEIIQMRLNADPNAVYFARSRDKKLFDSFHKINFHPPFHTTLCLETHHDVINKDLLKILRKKFENYNG